MWTVGRETGGKEGETGERVNGLPRPCEPPDHTGRAATTRPLQHPSNGSDLPSNRQTARLPDSYLTDRFRGSRPIPPSISPPIVPGASNRYSLSSRSDARSLISCSSLLRPRSLVPPLARARCPEPRTERVPPAFARLLAAFSLSRGFVEPCSFLRSSRVV